ncbi:phage major capsid protein [Mesorhizobium sp.]|uniref:phage major capsid protein n=1 Tax=Mesorhizobium sp. TaxID=1871066 RepID=UPI0025803202|nr:phage major capsid protein [Mesorhizobium sp.]
MKSARSGALTGALELKEADDAENVVTKALADLTKTVDDRLKAVEAKSGDSVKLTERFDKLEAKMNRPAAANSNVPAADNDNPTPEAKAFGTYLRRGDRGLQEIDMKALTVATDATAGFLAPTEFSSEILKALRLFSPLRQFAKVVTIAGSEIKFPRRIGSTAASWVSEIADRTESGPSYEQVTLTPWEMATFVEISRQLLEDAAYNVEGEVASDLAESFAIAEGKAFVDGTGTDRPKGILVATGIAEVKTGVAAAFPATNPADKLLDVMGAIPTAHAQNGAWAMNRNTLGIVRKWKDSQGNYLWQPGLQAGQPSSLLGRPVIEMVDFPDVAAGTVPIVFGDWSGYRIVDRTDFSILSDPYTRAKNGIVVLHSRKRVGGDVTNPDRFAKLKIAV